MNSTDYGKGHEKLYNKINILQSHLRVLFNWLFVENALHGYRNPMNENGKIKMRHHWFADWSPMLSGSQTYPTLVDTLG
jgi:hypothetical protein